MAKFTNRLNSMRYPISTLGRATKKVYNRVMDHLEAPAKAQDARNLKMMEENMAPAPIYKGKNKIRRY